MIMYMMAYTHILHLDILGIGQNIIKTTTDIVTYDIGQK